MKYGIAFRLLVLSLMAHVSMSATAAPVTWDLDNVALQGGATIAGSFTYDSEADTYSSVNVTATGAALPAFNTTYDTPLGSSNDRELIAVSGSCPGGDCTGQPVLVLRFADSVLPENSPLTLSTTNIALWTCGNSGCTSRSSTSIYRVAQGGAVTDYIPPPPQPAAPATPVPTMSTYGLVLTMLGLLLVAGRRLRASARRS